MILISRCSCHVITEVFFSIILMWLKSLEQLLSGQLRLRNYMTGEICHKKELTKKKNTGKVVSRGTRTRTGVHTVPPSTVAYLVICSMMAWSCPFNQTTLKNGILYSLLLTFLWGFSDQDLDIDGYWKCIPWVFSHWHYVGWKRIWLMLLTVKQSCHLTSPDDDSQFYWVLFFHSKKMYQGLSCSCIVGGSTFTDN